MVLVLDADTNSVIVRSIITRLDEGGGQSISGDEKAIIAYPYSPSKLELKLLFWEILLLTFRKVIVMFTE